MLDVMFYEVFREEEEAICHFLPKQIQAEFSEKPIQSECDTAAGPPAKLISIRTQSLIPIEWKDQLGGILTRSTGYDHISAYRKKTQISCPCGYLPSYCARAVAEHAFLMMLALQRNLKKQIRQFDEFNRNDLTGCECFGKTLLVLGVGNIGKEIVDLGWGIGMHVIGFDLVQRLSSLPYVSLTEGIGQADVVVCALPLTESTRGLLSYEVLKMLKPGALFINVSRAEISPVKGLNRLLSDGILGGLAMDIYEEEGRLAEYLRGRTAALGEEGKEILSLKNQDHVFLTPHNAFNTKEALRRKAKQSAEAVDLFLREGTFPNPVPVESIKN